MDAPRRGPAHIFHPAMAAPSDSEAIVKKLYPDQATFKKEEQRRFELLEAHWDVPLNELDSTAR